MSIEELEKESSDNIQDIGVPPIPISKRKYGGKFIAILNNKVVASGSTHIQTRHKVRKKIKTNERKSVKYYFIERKSNLLRSLFFCLIALVLVNIQLTEKILIFPIESIDFYLIMKRITILVFFDITIIASAVALTTLIDPIFRSHIDQGVVGDSIKRQEHQVGWEIALTTTTGYIFVVSIVGQLWISTEYNLSFELTYLTYLIIIILFIQIFFILIEDRKLKQLHNYLIDTITFNDRLTYKEIAEYLKEIPQLQKSNTDPALLLETIETSIESPFSIRNVIVFRIFIRDLSIMISSILIPFFITYIIFPDKYISRITGGFISAFIILFYGGIKQNSSEKWTPKFIAEHPKYTLKPGGVDRVYLKFFPNEVKKQKEETALTILTQSVAFSRGIGLVFLFYSSLSSIFILMNLSAHILDLFESLLIIFGVSLAAIYTTKIARQGTIAWVKSVEKNIQEMDKSLKTSFGFTPIEISNYLKEARKSRESVFKQS